MKPYLHNYVWPRASNHTFIVTLWLAAGIAYTARRIRAGQPRATTVYARDYTRLCKVRVLIVPYIHASVVALSCAGIGALLLRCHELLCHVSILARIIARGPVSGRNYLDFAAKTR